MIGLALLAAAQTAAMPPADWTSLPMLHYRRPNDLAPEASAFVRDEVAAGRCAAAVRGTEGWSLRVDLAVLGTGDGRVRRVVPRAIDCPSVEQFASGLVSALARDTVVAGGDGDAWYRTSVIFTWPG